MDRKTGLDSPTLASQPDSDAPPFVLTEAGAAGLRVVAVNAAGAHYGVQTDMRFTDARAVCPHLVGEPIDRAGDAKALTTLTAWHRRYSPSVAADGDDGVMADVTGCAHLFGGESAMAADLTQRLAKAGLTARVGLADTQGAAWALARFSTCTHALAPPGETRAALADLPMAALRLAPDTTTLLHRFGLTRIGQLYALNRSALARRFASKTAAEAVVLRLDQALNPAAEPFTPSRAPTAHRVTLPCPDPITHPEGVAGALTTLAQRLEIMLARRDCGGRGFRFTAFRADGSASCIQISTARPTRAPTHLIKLFAHRLERIDPGFGVDLFALEAARTGPMAVQATRFDAAWAGGRGDEAGVDALADRMAARLGDDAVQRMLPKACHIPEQAEGTAPWSTPAGQWADAVKTRAGARPLRVFDRPEPVQVMAEIPDGPPARFTWRRVTRTVARASGPERIAAQWWETPEAEPAPTRDYYVVEDREGRRYWLRRDGFYGQDTPPRWMIQGLFA